MKTETKNKMIKTANSKDVLDAICVEIMRSDSKSKKASDLRKLEKVIREYIDDERDVILFAVKLK